MGAHSIATLELTSGDRSNLLGGAGAFAVFGASVARDAAFAVTGCILCRLLMPTGLGLGDARAEKGPACAQGARCSEQLEVEGPALWANTDDMPALPKQPSSRQPTNQAARALLQVSQHAQGPGLHSLASAFCTDREPDQALTHRTKAFPDRRCKFNISGCESRASLPSSKPLRLFPTDMP